jgi:hypothetical protein
MLDTKTAIEKLTEYRKAYQSTRAVHDTRWTLSIALDAGQHWCYPTTQGGQTALKMLRPITDPNRDDVRATHNLIHKHVNQFIDGTSPVKVTPYCDPRSGASDDRIAAELSRNILDNWMQESGGLSILREKEQIRYVLGTAIVRRWMSAKGMIGKQQPSIRDFTYGWAHVYPWEVIRDPAATSMRPDRDEEFFAQEKPRTVAWVQRNFGVKIETQTTLGKLLDYQHQVHAASGMGGVSLSDSKTPAVLVYEACFQDPDMEKPWPWMLLGFRDPGQSGDDIIPLMPQGLIPNPFRGLPWSLFPCDSTIQAMWGFGIPIALRETQDIINMVWSTALRYHIMAQGKWLIEEGTVEKGNRGLSNRIDEPIYWKRTGTPSPQLAPSRIMPPQMNPVTSDLLVMAPASMMDQLNTSEVLRGISSKRGESGEAIDAKLKAASSPVERIRRDDDLTYQELLYNTLADLTNPERFTIDTARRYLGPDVPDEQAYMLLRKPVTEAVKSITLIAGEVHPKTPVEHEQGVILLAQNQLLEKDEAQWLLIQRGIDVNPLKSGAYNDQMNEVEQMKSGQDVQISPGEEHQYHIYALKLVINKSTWHTVPPDVQGRILTHLAMHKHGIIVDAQMDAMAQTQAAPQPTQQPSPTSTASEALAGSNAGSMVPAMNVA